MLKESFVWLPKVRAQTEQKVWAQGIRSWDDFAGASKVAGFSKARKDAYDWHVKQAKERLKEEDANYFAKAFRQGDHWRLFDQFGDEAVFLDIETDGYYGGVTVVGLYDGDESKTMVRGFNLDRHLFQKELEKYKLLVTFNGASFDVPVLERYFGVKLELPHVDLRFVCQKLGITGGLKSIEKELQIKRRKEVASFTGEDAVYLWQMWKSTGDKDYLDKLVWYNEEDIFNLKPLAKKVVPQLWEKTKAAVRIGQSR